MSDELHEIELLTVEQARGTDLDVLMDNFREVPLKNKVGTRIGTVISISREDPSGPLMGTVTGLSPGARQMLADPDSLAATCEIYPDYKGAGPAVRSVALFAKTQVDREKLGRLVGDFKQAIADAPETDYRTGQGAWYQMECGHTQFAKHCGPCFFERDRVRARGVHPGDPFVKTATTAGWVHDVSIGACVYCDSTFRDGWRLKGKHEENFRCTPCLRTHLPEPLTAPNGGCGSNRDRTQWCGKPAVATIDNPRQPWRACQEHADELNGSGVVKRDSAKVGTVAAVHDDGTVTVRVGPDTNADREKESRRLWRRYRKRQFEWERCGDVGTELCIHHRRVIAAHANACRFDGIEQNEATIADLQAMADHKRQSSPPAQLRKPTGWGRRFSI